MSTMTTNDREIKSHTANSDDIHTIFCEDLDSTVEKTIYEDGAEKIRELEQKIPFMKKYIIGNKRTPSSNSKFCFRNNEIIIVSKITWLIC